ncbi:MAG: hypothetical protein JKX80_02930 [Candidatus Pacebacteria bacterium]|nr:hypothetical protein [Candidatus Paceibacterota bacterium]
MKYFIGFLVLLALALAGFFISQNKGEDTLKGDVPEQQTVVSPTGVEHRIVLTKDGYTPSEISISAGDKIIFSTSPEYGKLHWPASNIHPTHSIYSEFDSKVPIEAEKTWSFVFGRVGEWRFHDHLAPFHTGVITVE